MDKSIQKCEGNKHMINYRIYVFFNPSRGIFIIKYMNNVVNIKNRSEVSALFYKNYILYIKCMNQSYSIRTIQGERNYGIKVDYCSAVHLTS